MKSIIMAYKHKSCEELEVTAPSFQISDGIEKVFINLKKIQFNLEFLCFSNQDFTMFKDLEFLGIRCDVTAGEIPTLYSFEFFKPEQMVVKIEMGKKG